MKFSLITSTLNRTGELVLLLGSLKKQTFKDFEFILVDQNSTDALRQLVEPYRTFFKIVYLRSDKGLSLGRNTGLKSATGDIVCFPDDDCEYPAQLLGKINEHFVSGHYEMIGCRVIDKTTGNEIGIKWQKANGPMNVGNMFATSSSVTIFISRKALGDMTFDERMGAGTPYGSGEETDLIYRLHLKKVAAGYFADIHVYHPHNELDYQSGDLKKIYLYGRGLGAFYKKHFFHRTTPVFYYYFFKSMFLSPTIGILRRLFEWKRLKAKFFSAMGTWNGFLTFK